MDKISNYILLSGAAIIGLMTRALYVLFPARVYGDMAVYALMAKRISELKEFPVYMWLAHYAGALTCYAAALAYRVFGVSGTSFNLVIFGISVAWIAVSFLLARQLLPQSGYIPALLFLLIPVPSLFDFSLSGAGYGESLVFGALILFLASSRGAGALLGFAMGAGLWVFPVTAPLLPAVILALFINDRRVFISKPAVFMAAGFFLGYFPAVIYNIQYPGAALFRFLGRVLDLDRSVLSTPDLAGIVRGKILWRISTVPGAIAGIPYKIYKLCGLLNASAFIASAAWITNRAWRGYLTTRKIDGLGLAALYAICYILFYAIFVGGEQLRYIIPLLLLVPLFIGKALSDIRTKSRIVFIALLILLLAENAFGIGRLFAVKEARHYRELSARLESMGIHHGYSDYWLAYPVIFESKEKVIISPTLFDPVRDDRKPEYTARVKDSDNYAFVIDRTAYPALDGAIEGQLNDKGIDYSKDEFKEFIIYYGFSKKARPGEFRLGPAR